MSFKPLTSEAIAMTEKKMDMSLEDIIKMSKKNPPKAKNQRVSNRNQNTSNQTAQDKSLKVRHFIDSRSSIRQGTLAQRRSNFQGNRFPLTTETARNAAMTSIPVRGRVYNRSRAVNNNMNKPRFGGLPFQKNIGSGGSFSVKQQHPKEEVNILGKQRPQTLDSRFANMKEERLMKALAEQNNKRVRRNGFAQNSSRQQKQHQWVGRRGNRGSY